MSRKWSGLLWIPYDYDFWNKGLGANVIVPEASLGYVILDNKRLKLAPFAGFGGMNITPTENELNKDPDLKNAEFKMTKNYSLGFNTDIKISKIKTGTSYAGTEVNYNYLR